MKRKISIVLALALVLVMATACVHRGTTKPYTPLDYAKATMNTNAQLLKVAHALINDMPTYPLKKVQEAYPKAQKLYAKAWYAEMAFAKAVKVWETSKIKPANLDALEKVSNDFVGSLMDLLKEVGVWK